MKNKRFPSYYPILFGIMFLLLFSACSKDDDKPSDSVQMAVLTTKAISNITQSSANSGGVISFDGGSGVIARGVCWSTTINPTTTANKTSDGSGSGTFTSMITGLSPNVKYYVRAYAINSVGTSYGQQVEFTTDSDLANGLISYWTLDDNAGTIATDAAGSWDLSFVNSPSWTSSGKINNAIDFGTTSMRYIEKTGINSGNKNTYSLSAWIYLEDNLPSPKLIMGMNSGGNAINAGAAEVKLIVTIDNQLAALYHTNDGAPDVMQRISGSVIALNTWYYVVGVINSGTINLYINSVADNTNSVTNTTSSNLNFINGRVTIGHARYYGGVYNPDRWFRGKIDEAAIWDRALTADEVETLFNNGNGLQYPF